MWKSIREFNDRYEISDLGQVRKKKEIIVRGNGRRQALNEKILTPILGSTGYLKVRVARSIGSKMYNAYIHRLVAIYFLKNALDGQTQVNHIDGDKTNNKVENLEWVTPKDNIRHAWRSGLSNPSNEIAIVVDGRSFKSITECSKFFKCSTGTLYDRINKKGLDLTMNDFFGKNAFILDGVLYKSKRDAAVKLGVSRTKLSKMVF